MRGQTRGESDLFNLLTNLNQSLQGWIIGVSDPMDMKTVCRRSTTVLFRVKPVPNRKEEQNRSGEGWRCVDMSKLAI